MVVRFRLHRRSKRVSRPSGPSVFENPRHGRTPTVSRRRAALCLKLGASCRKKQHCELWGKMQEQGGLCQ